MDVAEARRRSSASSATEFQFWPLDANPTASPSCADELFAGGVLLPLPVLPPKAASHARSDRSHVSVVPPSPEPETETESEPEPDRRDASLLATVDKAAPAVASGSGAAITSAAPPAAAGAGGSKRWTDIFSKKPAEEKEKEKEKRKDAGGGGGRKPAAHAGNSGGGGGSELNINIWPFSRSRSAGGSSSKPRPSLRKASSAPCSRSNSRGEAAGPLPPRRWAAAASPGRAGGGVPVGRSSPVWQIRRPATRHAAPVPEPFTDRRERAQAQQNKVDKPAAASGGRKTGGLGGGVRGLNLSVNSCIGYRHQVSCRRADAVAARGHHGEGGGGLFGIKGLFSKKVH